MAVETADTLTAGNIHKGTATASFYALGKMDGENVVTVIKKDMICHCDVFLQLACK